MSSVAAALKCAKKASCTNPGIVCASRACQKVMHYARSSVKQSVGEKIVRTKS